MNKTLIKVFVIIGILVLCLLVWAFVFGNGFKSIYDAFRTPVNAVYKGIAGSHANDLLPEWDGGAGANVENAGGNVVKPTW